MNGEPGEIVLEDISYRYPGSDEYALRDVSLSISSGEFVALLGRNRAGKSTLCQVVSGIIPHSRGGRLRGSVWVGGSETRDTTVAQLTESVGMVLEDPGSQLFTTRVLDEVAFGPENLCLRADEIRARVSWALTMVGLEGMEERSPTSLSGGQKQRLAIASVLAMRPRILILDEATAQLDPVGKTDVMRVACNLNRDDGITVIVASDDGEGVAEFADRAVVIHHGHIVADDSPRKVFRDWELIQGTAIRRPQVSHLAFHLLHQGLRVEPFPVSVEEASRALEALMQGGGR
jgi:energy-coupling factor transporter ATP-binding protein EcfA2